MKISAELSLYPLSANYKTAISEYIASLKKHTALEVRVNALSTEVFGDYDSVMQAIQSTTKAVFEHNNGTVLVAKFLNRDRSQA